MEEASLRAGLRYGLVALLVSCASSIPRGEDGVRVVRGPYLQAVSRHEATILWRTNAPAAVASNDVLTRSNLAEATTYTYRIPGEEKDRSFTTAPAPGASFRALVFGDSGTASTEQYALARRMERERFDVILHTGDIVYPDGLDEDFDRTFFVPYEKILAEHPFFATIGNHDMQADGSSRAYLANFVDPANNPERSKLYYSFTWGCAKFVSIESYHLFKQPGRHLDWLERELASNDLPWLVLVMHVSPYASGPHGDSVELQRTLEPLIRKYHVSLLLAGHDHLYERGEKDGWTWVVTGGGGAKLYPVKNPHIGARHTESAYHYVLVDFERSRLAGKMVRLDGTVGDSFEIRR